MDEIGSKEHPPHNHLIISELSYSKTIIGYHSPVAVSTPGT